MAHYTPQAGIEGMTGALSKRKDADRLSIMRRKSVKDPLTGEEVGLGPKEIYLQHRRDYKGHPMTAGETHQRGKWTEACRLASMILKDKNHPRYMEMYHRWREHVRTAETPMQFPNFIRTMIVRETQAWDG